MAVQMRRTALRHHGSLPASTSHQACKAAAYTGLHALDHCLSWGRPDEVNEGYGAWTAGVHFAAATAPAALARCSVPMFAW